MTEDYINRLRIYNPNISTDLLTIKELEQMAQDGFPVSGGGAIPSDYDGKIFQTHQDDGRTK